MRDDVFHFLPVAVRVKTELAEEILSGRYGGSGERFMPVRELCRRRSVSLATAQKIMTMLQQDGLLEVASKRHYLGADLDRRQKRWGAARRSSPRIFGLIVTNLSNPFFAELAEEFEQAAAREGAHALVAGSRYDVARERRILRDFVAAGVMGIAAAPSLAPGSVETYRSLRVPLVFVGREMKDVPADSVLVDNDTAGEMVARHVLRLGFDRFGYIGAEGFPEDPRRKGFERGLHRERHRLSASHTLNLSNLQDRSWEKKLSVFVETLPRTGRLAVFCFNDLFAVALLRVCARKGIEVPGRVAVAGFDDLPIARQTEPRLTTIAYPHAALADLAVARLVEIGERKRDDSRVVSRLIEPHLVVRGSTDAAAPDEPGPSRASEREAPPTL